MAFSAFLTAWSAEANTAYGVALPWADGAIITLKGVHATTLVKGASWATCSCASASRARLDNSSRAAARCRDDIVVDLCRLWGPADTASDAATGGSAARWNLLGPDEHH